MSTSCSEVIAAEGCEIESQKINNGMKYILRFPKPLMRSESHKISFIELSPKQNENSRKAIAMEIARSFSIPTYKYNLEAIFIGQKPRIVWKNNMLTILERPGQPDKHNSIAFSADVSNVIKSFTHLHGGIYSGIAWEW